MRHDCDQTLPCISNFEEGHGCFAPRLLASRLSDSICKKQVACPQATIALDAFKVTTTRNNLSVSNCRFLDMGEFF